MKNLMIDDSVTTDAMYELSIVIPCLNEELTVGETVDLAHRFLLDNQINGEVILVDNGSTDRSAEIAAERGARIVVVNEKGYGNALRGGFAAANSTFVIMADADGNHDMSSSNLLPFVEGLRDGYDMVVGNRFAGGIDSGAMSWMRRYVGNPILSFLGRLFFKTPVRDFHCGLRGIRHDSLERMQLQTTGMELASEMIVKSALLNMRVMEVSTRQLADHPDRASHLNTFRDGWRHLRFLLLYSPQWLFFYPGIFMLVLGLVFSIRLFVGPIPLGRGIVDFHSLIYAGTFTIIGLNLLSFATISHVYAYNHNLLPLHPRWFRLLRGFNLERGILLGGLLALVGAAIMLFALYLGLTRQFSSLERSSTIRMVYGSSLLLVTGTQIIFTSFIVSILGLKLSTGK